MKLKTCPFCGGEADIDIEAYGGTAGYVSTIYCVEGCVSMDDQYGEPKEAIKRWNTRVE